MCLIATVGFCALISIGFVIHVLASNSDPAPSTKTTVPSTTMTTTMTMTMTGTAPMTDGVPIDQSLWQTMNGRDLFLMEMALRMKEYPGHSGKIINPSGIAWGDNPSGIANPGAYRWKPQETQDFSNSYIGDIESIKLLAYDKFIFPDEKGNPYTPFPTPRWSVVRIRHQAKDGDTLVIAFRPSAGPFGTAKDWDLDGNSEASEIMQDDKVRFVKGFFDDSLCVLMENGLSQVLQSEAAAGVTEILTTGCSLGGAWSSILMTRLAPNIKMTCPNNRVYTSPFGDVAAKAVTFGKPGIFYQSGMAIGREIPLGWKLAERQTDYVYHADPIARANHAGLKACVFFCWGMLESSGAPFFKPGKSKLIANHYHGDTLTVWILNDLTGDLTKSDYPAARRSQVAVFSNEIARSKKLNIDFIVASLSKKVFKAASDEHGYGYQTVPWELREPLVQNQASFVL